MLIELFLLFTEIRQRDRFPQLKDPEHVLKIYAKIKDFESYPIDLCLKLVAKSHNFQNIIRKSFFSKILNQVLFNLDQVVKFKMLPELIEIFKVTDQVHYQLYFLNKVPR
jgi:hypothetical protein